MNRETLLIELCPDWLARLDVDHAQRPPVVAVSVISNAEAEAIETQPQPEAVEVISPAQPTTQPEAVAVISPAQPETQPEAVAVISPAQPETQPEAVAVISPAQPTTQPDRIAVIDRRQLSRAIKRLAATVATGRLAKTRPVLGGCLITSDNSGVFLATTDTEVEAVEIVDAVAGAGLSHVVDFKALRAAVGTCKADEITIDGRNPEWLRIGSASIPTIAPADDFPALGVAGFSQAASVMIDAATLADCLAATVSARDEGSTRFALGGVFLEVASGGGVRAIATDGRRLHVAESATASDSMVGSIIPADCVAAVISAAGVAGGGVVVEFYSRTNENGDQQPDRARFSMFRDSGEQCGEIVARVVDGRFPNWQACFSGEFQPLAEAPGADLLRLVSSASQLVKLTGGQWRGVELSAVGGRLAVSSMPRCPVAFSDSISATTTDAEPINLDCQYLRDVLTAVEGLAVAPISLQISTGGACLIKAAGQRVSFRAMVMSIQ